MNRVIRIGFLSFQLTSYLAGAQTGQIFQEALKDYYNFNYSDAIEGLIRCQENFQSANEFKSALKCDYYLAMSYFELGDISTGLDYLLSGSGEAIAAFGEESPEASDFYSAFAKYYHNNESYDTAILFYQTAHELRKQHNADNDLELGELYANLAYAYDFNSQFDSALYFYELAAGILEENLGLNHPYTSWVVGSMAYPASKSGNFQKELEAAIQSLEIKKELWGSDSEDVAEALAAVAIAYQHLDRYTEEQQYFGQALDLKIKLYGPDHEKTGLAHDQLGSAYSRLNQTEQAVNHVKQSHGILKKALGNSHPSTCRVLRNLGNVYYDGGQYQLALDPYKEYLKIRSKEKSYDMELVRVYLSIAEIHEQLGNFEKQRNFVNEAQEIISADQDLFSLFPALHLIQARLESRYANYRSALQLLTKATEANEKFNIPDREERAFILNNTGTLYKAMGRYRSAEKVLMESLRIRLDLWGPESANYAQTLTNLSLLYIDIGKTHQAKDSLEKVLAIKRDYFGYDHPEVAGALFNLSVATGSIGDIHKEIDLLKEVLTIRIKHFGLKHNSLIPIYHNLALAKSAMCSYDEALTLAQSAHVLTTDIYGGDSQEAAVGFTIMGKIKNDQGELSKSMQFHEKALEIYKKQQVETIGLANAYNNLGATYLATREIRSAKINFEEALRIYDKLFGPNGPSSLTTRNNLGLTEYEKSNYQAAISIYKNCIQDGLELDRDVDPMILVQSYLSLGSVYEFTKRPEDAVPALKEAERILIGIDRPAPYQLSVLGDVQNNIGAAYLKQGEYGSAEKYLLRAQKLYDQIYTGRTYRLARIFNNLANVYYGKGEFTRAMSYIDRAELASRGGNNELLDPLQYYLALVRKVDINYVLYRETNERKYLDDSEDFLRTANEVLAILEQNIVREEDQIQMSNFTGLLTAVAAKNSKALYDLSGDADYLDRFLYYAERSKSNVLLRALERTRVKNYRGVDPSLAAMEKEHREGIRHLEEEIFKNEYKGEPASSRIQALKKERLSRSEELRKMSVQIENSKKLRDRMVSEIIKLKDLQQQLLPKNAVIEYAMSDSVLQIIVIGKEESRIFSTSFDTSLVDAIGAIRNAILYKVDMAINEYADRLHHLLLKDALDFLEEMDVEIDEITIVPEGPLNYLPFEVLRRDGKYLVELFDINYSYSLTLDQKIKEADPSYESGMMVSITPTFSDKSLSQLTPGAMDMFLASNAAATEGVRGFSMDGGLVTPLPGTMTEVDAIGEIAGTSGISIKNYSDEEAKEELVKGGILKNQQYLHFATHGFVNEVNPEFSGLLFSQVTDQDEDCVLFASEIYGLDLRADLVTLSACETGLGKFEMGEGVVGLARAFFYAGARNLIVSQWKVSDESTSRLMVDFYRYLFAGESKSKALRSAKLNLISDEEFDAPYYWAPFLLIGR